MPKKLFSLIITFLLAAGGFFFLPAVRVLSVSSRKNPAQVFYSAAACKEGFIISYTHSVNKGRVPGAVFTVTDDGYFIENLNRYLPRLTMAVGLIANHSLAAGSDFYEQREYFLTSFFEPQTSIILEIKRISLFKYMRLSDPVRQ